MIYVVMRKTVSVEKGQPLTLGQIAECHDTSGDVRPDDITVCAAVRERCLSVGAADVIRAITQKHPQETVQIIGQGQTWVMRKPQKQNPAMVAVKNIIAALILFFGTGLALTYFHSDVDMHSAQDRFIAAIAPGTDGRWMSIPYALGVGAGVIGFFGLITRKKPTPLDLSFYEYQTEVEDFLHAQSKGET